VIDDELVQAIKHYNKANPTIIPNPDAVFSLGTAVNYWKEYAKFRPLTLEVTGEKRFGK